MEDGEVLFVGFHWPMLIARIARRLQAPNIVIVYEGGIIEDRLTPVTPPSPSDLAAAVDSPMCAGSLESLYMWLGAGRVHMTLLEAPIVDRHGNVNTTAIGLYERPTVRLPGSGGGTELASMGPGLVLISTSTAARSYPDHVDYITSPGYLGGAGERVRSGYKPGRGPKLLLNPLGLFTFEPDEDLHPKALHPGVTADQVISSFGWPIAVPDPPDYLPEPAEEELLIARDELAHAAERSYRLPGTPT